MGTGRDYKVANRRSELIYPGVILNDRGQNGHEHHGVQILIATGIIRVLLHSYDIESKANALL